MNREKANALLKKNTMLSAKGQPLIEMKDLVTLEMLESGIIFADEFAALPDDKQKEIYTYCKCHAGHGCINENLAQIRYGITAKHFGF